MSWKLTGIVSQKRVGSMARRMLLLSMADKANDDGSGVYASFATLADMCESSRPTVKRLVKEFIEEGLLRHVGMRACANGATNEYDIDVAAVEALPNLWDKTGVKADPVHHDPGSTRTGVRGNEPGSPRTPTRVMVTPKPILEPKVLGSNEPSTLVGKENSLGVKPGGKRTGYPPAFQALWLMWPRPRRELSDKRKAFERWQDALKIWPEETILRAAKMYLAKPDVKKENFKYCRLAQVFLNGGLEAAIEAAQETKRSRVWSSEANTWVEA